MNTIDIIKFLHIISAITFAGLLVANYFYLTYSLTTKDKSLLHYAYRFNQYADGIIFILLVASIITGSLLVHPAKLQFNTPWIMAAYLLFSLTTVAWIVQLIIKWINYSRLKTDKPFSFKKSYHAINILIFIFLILIVHDAVMHKTYLL